VNTDQTLFKKGFPPAPAQWEKGSRRCPLLQAEQCASGTHRCVEKDLLEMGTKCTAGL